MVIGPIKQWIVGARGMMTELTTLRIFGLFVFVRADNAIIGLRYGELCRGLDGFVFTIAPRIFDALCRTLRP